MNARVAAVCSIVACVVLLAMQPRLEESRGVGAKSPPRPEPMELLPESTVFAVELRGVASRWSEIRAVPAIARFQDRVFGALGIDVAEVPRALGDRAVIGLVADEQRGSLFPVAVLQPSDPQDATGRLRDLERSAVIPYSVERYGNLVTVAPESIAQQLQPPVSGQGSEVRQRLRAAEVDARLPEGGLVRGWLDPRGVSRLLRDRVEGGRSYLVELLADLFAAELEVMRFAGFRRDLTPNGLVTDAVVGFDATALPPEVRRVFRSPTSAREVPESLPPGVVALLTFGTEREAVLPWLRHVSEDDPRGVLRNLEFWLAEFEASTGVNAQHDLLALLGQRAWLALFRGADPGDAQIALLCETGDAEQLERNLLEVRSWVSAHLLGRTLGLAVPQITDMAFDGEVVHGLALRTPFGELQGLRFLLSHDWLILGNGEQAVTAGRELLSELQRRTNRTASAGPAIPNESARVSGPELAKLVSSLVPPNRAGQATELAPALAELLEDLDVLALDAWYEGEEVRLHGRVRFR